MMEVKKMREVNKVVQIEENAVVNKVITKEEIVSFTSDSKLGLLSVSIEMRAEDDTIAKVETHYFSGEDYVRNPSELELWSLIDKIRNV